MAKKEKKQKIRKPGYVGAGKFWAWQSREISDAGFMFLTGYIVFYCTDVLKLDPLIVGSLFAASKIIDGITDIIAGYIVDRTNTKMGRGRPYDICLLGAWISIVMLFICPRGWGEGARLAWVVVWYILANAVFYTFLNAGEGVFMLRAFNKDQIVKLSTHGAIATSLLGFICGIFIPQMVSNAGKDPAAWAKMAITIAVPLALIGLCRMLFVKEENDTVTIAEEKVKTGLKDIFTMFGKNKYVVIICIILLISNIVSNLGVGVYYFDKIIGDIGIQSVFAAASALAVFALVFLPKLMAKLPLAKILMGGQIIAAILSVICFIFYDNIPILVAGYVLSIFATLPGVYATRILLSDLAIFNEYLGLNRMEGTMSSVQGFMKRAGSALGTFILGVALTLIKYDADATELAPITFWGLRIMMYGLPVVSALIQGILWAVYDIEKRLPKIKEELAERKADEATVAVSETVETLGE